MKTIDTTTDRKRIIELAIAAITTCIERNTVNELELVRAICLGLGQMHFALRINARVEGVAGDGNGYLAHVVGHCFANQWSITERYGLLSSFENMRLLFGQALAVIKTAEEDRARDERLKLAMAVLKEISFGGDAETPVASTEAVVVEPTTPPAQPAAPPIAATAPKPVTTVKEGTLDGYRQKLIHLVMKAIDRNLLSRAKGGKGMENPKATEYACGWGMQLVHDPDRRLRRTTPFTAAEAAELEKVLIDLLKPMMNDREIDAFFDRKDAELGLPKRPQRHSIVTGITLDPSSPKLTKEQIQEWLSGKGAGQQVHNKKRKQEDATPGKLSKKELKRAKKAAQELKQNAARDANPAAAETIKLAPPLETALNIDELDDATLEAATAPQAEPGFDLPLYRLLGPAQLQSDAQNAA